MSCEEKRGFDCVAWTRKTRDRISAELKDLSTEERLQWFRNWRPSDPVLAKLYDRGRNNTDNGGLSDDADERDVDS